jgi:PII-like signaling protein
MAWVQGLSVRILTHERVRVGRKSVVDAAMAIVQRDGLAGMTVTRAVEGWSAHGGVRTASWVELSDDLPIVIEIVDRVEKIEAALSDITAISEHGVTTVTEMRLFVADSGNPGSEVES